MLGYFGTKVGELAVNDCELADDFAKVGVDVDSHVVEILLCCWLVHGVTVVISHRGTDIRENEIVGGMGRSVTQVVLWVSSIARLGSEETLINTDQILGFRADGVELKSNKLRYELTINCGKN